MYSSLHLNKKKILIQTRAFHEWVSFSLSWDWLWLIVEGRCVGKTATHLPSPSTFFFIFPSVSGTNQGGWGGFYKALICMPSKNTKCLWKFMFLEKYKPSPFMQKIHSLHERVYRCLNWLANWISTWNYLFPVTIVNRRALTTVTTLIQSKTCFAHIRKPWKTKCDPYEE